MVFRALSRWGGNPHPKTPACLMSAAGTPAHDDDRVKVSPTKEPEATMNRNRRVRKALSTGRDGRRGEGLAASRVARLAVAVTALAPVAVLTADPAVARIAVNHNETPGTDAD